MPATMLTPETIANLRKLHEAATPGTWDAERWDLDSGAFEWHIRAIHPPDMSLVAVTSADDDHKRAKHDAALLVALRNNAEALLSAAEEAERLRGQLGDLRLWAQERWSAEVEHRPPENVHRRTLDSTWKQVMRHLDSLLATEPR